MQNGTIKRLVREKGFGFIDGTDGHSYFFHVSELVEGQQLEDLAEGDPVVYNSKESPKGPRAVSVQRA
jgi:cold shock protein